MSEDILLYNNQLNEAIATYLNGMETKSNLTVAHKNITYEGLLSDRMLLVEAITAGVPMSIFNLVRKEALFSDEEWAGFLDISKRSLDRFKLEVDHIFKASHSEKIFELAEVTRLGKNVFDTFDDFYDWLLVPNFALGNHKPIGLLSNSYGKELVLNELHSIDQGIFV
jgi:putative toxin-antitoxin system antitoxin component (TIGR02293 family)